MDWDNFRYFAAIAQTGSVRGAALMLGVNPSTVTRRLEALEQSLGVMLFIRSVSGLALTREGTEVVARVDLVAGQLDAIEATLRGRDQRLAGAIRVAVPEVLAVTFLLAELAPFMAQYPDIELELVPGSQNANISRGAVDVAIRATESPPEDMIGRALHRVALAAYVRRDMATAIGETASPADVGWIDWAGQGEVMQLYEQLRKRFFPKVRVTLRCDQIFMQHAAVQAGMGVGILPCYLGDGDVSLARLPQMPVQAGPSLWLLTHADLRSTRRVQVFMAFVRDVFTRRAPELIGEPL